MDKNIGKTDRLLRLSLAAIMVVIALTITSPLRWIAWLVAAIMIVTSLVSICPIYSILGIKTCKTR